MTSLSKWLVAVATVCVAHTPPQSAPVRIVSPDRHLSIEVSRGSERLSWSVNAGATPVIEASDLGISFDGRDLGEGAQIRSHKDYSISDSFPWRGAVSEVRFRANGARISVSHPATSTDYTIDVRVSNDAVAFRFVVTGSWCTCSGCGSDVHDPGKTRCHCVVARPA